MHFPSFPNLPAELRAKIWCLALRERMSIIELRRVGNSIQPASRPHAVFHINQESRHEAILALPTCVSLSTDEVGTSMLQNYLYCDPEQDTLFFSRDCRGQWTTRSVAPALPRESPDHMERALSLLATSLSAADRAKVGRLAINMYSWYELIEPEGFMRELCRFEGLRTLVIVVRPQENWKGENPGGGEVGFVEARWRDGTEIEELKNKVGEIFRDARRECRMLREPELQVVELKGEQPSRKNYSYISLGGS